MDSSLQEWIIEADITRLQAVMEEGAVTSEELVQAYLERIARYDIKINSILEINPDALETARALDRERQERGSRGKLHGIPLVLKDNIDTKDRMPTTAGSIALAGSFAAADAGIAAKLRSAGAVFLGKANMTEWSNFMSSRMPAGYSSHGGYVLNPYGPGELFVSGSSSGPAAAAAANLAAAAIGTETAGSIVGPASQHLLVGIKPTVGLASRSGIIPISGSQDTPGPLARTVTDAAIILSVIAGRDDRDEATWAAGETGTHRDYTDFLDASFLRQARIGIPRHYYNHLDQDRRLIMEQAIAALIREGATLIDPVELHLEEQSWNNDLICYEFKRDLNGYLSQLADLVPVHSLKELIDFNEQHAETALRFGQDNLIRAEACQLDEEGYREQRQASMRLSLEKGIDAVLDTYSLDALLLPGDVDGMYIAARLGYPLIAVPAGYAAEGIIDADGDSTKGPFGVVFSGRAFSEPTLLRIAYGFEQATRHRFPPTLVE
ncbi:amidase family protein [Paenibacillus filicis]|uniref:Amidase family protein n=1 Tax=Paenibacillus filicis TaxID=669464 RepID=A0ABU9DGI1_9BACL